MSLWIEPTVSVCDGQHGLARRVGAGGPKPVVTFESGELYGVSFRDLSGDYWVSAPALARHDGLIQKRVHHRNRDPGGVAHDGPAPQ